MLTKNQSLIASLVEVAKSSQMLQRHAAAVVSGKRILSLASNFRSDLTLNHLLTKGNRKSLAFSVHAEQCAIQKVQLAKVSRSKLKVLVIRINSDCDLMQSKPCSECIAFMRSKNIKKVTYSNADGNLITESLVVITQDHTSQGFRVIFRYAPTLVHLNPEEKLRLK